MASSGFDLINNALNLGAGLFAYSKEQLEKTVQKLVEAGKVERKDASNFAEDLMKTGQEQRDEIQKMINSTVKTNLEEMGITNPQPQLTADDIRQIVREELAANDKK